MFRIGRRDYTTLEALKDMVRKCQEDARRRGSTSTRHDKQWIIRDGASFIRTGCAEHERESAEKRLAAYLGQKHTPQRSDSPLIADILFAYRPSICRTPYRPRMPATGLPISRNGGAIER